MSNQENSSRDLAVMPRGEVTIVPSDNTRPYLVTGVFIVLLLIGGLGLWSVSSHLDGAVIADGRFTVRSSHKSVQHLEGGIVQEILVKDGGHVKAGDLLLRLDDTLDRANFDIVTGQLDELQTRAARLTAEQLGAERIEFPSDLSARASDPDVRRSIAGEESLFAARRKARAGTRLLLRERIAGLREEIAGLTEQAESKLRQIALLEKELTGLRTLYEKGYAPLTRILALERQAEALAGERAADRAAIARARNAIGETELELARMAAEHLEAVTAELRATEAEIFELRDRKVAVESRLRRVEVRAPEGGRVLNMAVKTVGGVIQGGEPLLDIVPQDEALVVEVRVPVQDIDRVAPGLASVVRLSAINQADSPEVNGLVDSVSADRIVDDRTGEPYFLARIRLEDQEAVLGSSVQLVPGMPAEVFIRTGERTALSYFLKPLTDRLARTFKEG